jgi:hypothetical protein
VLLAGVLGTAAGVVSARRTVQLTGAQVVIELQPLAT